jgi:Polyketide cyclase / dehydrase and lipid transport
MPKVFYSSVIPASIDRIWAIVRNFKELPAWHPSFCDCSIEENRPSEAIGCVRSFYLKSGGHLRERLLALSDRDHICTYTILESLCHITDYVARFSCYP